MRRYSFLLNLFFLLASVGRAAGPLRLTAVEDGVMISVASYAGNHPSLEYSRDEGASWSPLRFHPSEDGDTV
ncbi:MAG: hypothetical protein IKZ67_04410, partial [Paludibacteraceae bacterium]|nr:hypothetical protein [Paludibacteraceae bacterium]